MQPIDNVNSAVALARWGRYRRLLVEGGEHLDLVTGNPREVRDDVMRTDRPARRRVDGHVEQHRRRQIAGFTSGWVPLSFEESGSFC